MNRSKPLKRTALKRAPTKKRKPRANLSPRCVVRACNLPQRVLDRCRKHAMKKADDLARAYILDRDKHRCRDCGTTQGTMTWAHIIRRNQGRWVRHARYGAVTLCWPCHYRFTNDEASWVDWLDQELGPCFHKRLRLIRNKADYDGPALAKTLLGFGYQTK